MRRRLPWSHAAVIAAAVVGSVVAVGIAAAVGSRAQATRQAPVPPIRTALGSMPGVAEVPDRTEMPDVLVMNDGQKVTTAAEWKRRREEMKRLLAYYDVGLMPPAPGRVAGRELVSHPVLDGAVHYRLVHLSFGASGTLGFDVAIFTPAATKGPLPTIIFPSFSPTPGAAILPTQVRPPEQGKGLDALTIPLGDQTARAAAAAAQIGSPSRAAAPVPAAPDPDSAARTHSGLFRRGYALVTYHYQDTGEDTIGRLSDGSWAFRSTRFFPAYPGYDWGLLGGWAWGISRVVDYLVTQPFADKGRLIATGHSRLGKAVLIAGAFDERLALTAPAGSGAGGTGAYRFNGAAHGGREGLADMMRKYPNWFSPHLHEFAADVDRLPFDQHWLIALAAPRAFISLEGTDDQNCVSNAVKEAFVGARPAFALLGATGRLGVNFAPHRHAFTAEDWVALLDFADQQLLGRSVDRRFDQFPAESIPPRIVLDVRQLGAAGDGRTKDTAVFQKALDRAFESGGGDVVVPAGSYLIGSIVIRSNTTLRLEQGAALLGSPDLDDYPPTRVRWEGRWVDSRRALIAAENAHHIAIVGPGRIVGNPAVGSRKMPYRTVLIEPVECRFVLLEGFSTEHTGMWSIHPTYCEDVTVRRLTIRSTGGDGIDVDSCRHVVIEYCDIDTGDDAIAIKSGRGMEGYRIGRPTEDVLISHCTLGDSHFACIGIGSETSGGIRDIRIEHCTFTHAKTYAVYIKSRPGRGAYIEDISGRDLEIAGSAGFLCFNLTNSGLQDPEPVPGDEGIPAARNFTFSDVRVNGGQLVDGASVPPEKPLDGLSLVNITGRCEKGIELANVRRAELREISVLGVAGPLLAISNVTGTGLAGAVPLQIPPPRTVTADTTVRTPESMARNR